MQRLRIWPSIFFWKKNCATPPGFEPEIPWFVVRCLIHWATGPPWKVCVIIYSLLEVRVISRSGRLRYHPFFNSLSSLSCFPLFLDFSKQSGRDDIYSVFESFFFFFVLLKITKTVHVETSHLTVNCFFGKKKLRDFARIRTWSPLIRSQMPYPLGHGAILERMVYSFLEVWVISRSRITHTSSSESPQYCTTG